MWAHLSQVNRALCAAQNAEGMEDENDEIPYLQVVMNE